MTVVREELAMTVPPLSISRSKTRIGRSMLSFSHRFELLERAEQRHVNPSAEI